MVTVQLKKAPFSVVLCILLFFTTPLALGAIGVYDFDSEQDRARFQLLVQELRCPKCQNQNLSDSNSEISVDLRDQVARMVKEGLSDEQIKEYMVNRYGDFVLYRPPLQSNTMVLWWAPLLMVLVGAGVFVAILLRRRALSSSDEENDTTNDLIESRAQESPDGAGQSD